MKEIEEEYIIIHSIFFLTVILDRKIAIIILEKSSNNNIDMDHFLRFLISYLKYTCLEHICEERRCVSHVLLQPK